MYDYIFIVSYSPIKVGRTRVLPKVLVTWLHLSCKGKALKPASTLTLHGGKSRYLRYLVLIPLATRRSPSRFTKKVGILKYEYLLQVPTFIGTLL